MRSEAPDPVTLAEAVAKARTQIALLDQACEAIGRDPRTVRRSVLAYRTQVFGSTGAFEDYAGRYAELGFDECIASCKEQTYLADTVHTSASIESQWKHARELLSLFFPILIAVPVLVDPVVLVAVSRVAVR